MHFCVVYKQMLVPRKFKYELKQVGVEKLNIETFLN